MPKIEMLNSKIHRATVTEADIDYVGSITIDEDLLKEANILEYQKVLVVDVNNGARFETYTIKGEKGSGMICLNGPAALCANVGDKVIIMTFIDLDPDTAKKFKPTVVFVDDDNKIIRKAFYEKYGKLKDQ